MAASGANTYVWSNGATGSTNIVNTAGTYTVTGTDANGCMAFAHKTVTVDTLPVVTINGTTSFCYGSSTTLTASGANTYVWSTEEATNNITVTNGGIFSVTGTNANNCQGMATAETFVLPLPTPVISGDTVICSYETTTLIAGGGVEYEWITGDTSNQIQVTAGTYSVTVTDIYGCHATTSQTVTVLPSSLQQLSILAKTHADGTPYMLIYPQAGLLYQWYRDGDAISGATGQYYVPEGDLQTSTACYRVLVRPDILHCGIMTDCWVKTDASAAKVCILPNPNDGRFRLLLPSDAVSVRIFNANGQLVLARETAGEIELTISADLANGLYMVRLRTVWPT